MQGLCKWLGAWLVFSGVYQWNKKVTLPSLSRRTKHVISRGGRNAINRLQPSLIWRTLHAVSHPQLLLQLLPPSAALYFFFWLNHTAQRAHKSALCFPWLVSSLLLRPSLSGTFNSLNSAAFCPDTAPHPSVLACVIRCVFVLWRQTWEASSCLSPPTLLSFLFIPHLITWPDRASPESACEHG